MHPGIVFYLTEDFDEISAIHAKLVDVVGRVGFDPSFVSQIYHHNDGKRFQVALETQLAQFLSYFEQQKLSNNPYRDWAEMCVANNIQLEDLRDEIKVPFSCGGNYFLTLTFIPKEYLLNFDVEVSIDGEQVGEISLEGESQQVLPLDFYKEYSREMIIKVVSPGATGVCDCILHGRFVAPDPM